MPRKTRIEIEGGLYHTITRGNGRKDIFHAREDQRKRSMPGDFTQSGLFHVRSIRREIITHLPKIDLVPDLAKLSILEAAHAAAGEADFFVCGGLAG